MLSTSHLDVDFTHRRQTTVLLHDLNLRLERGHLVSLLGKNGAGKSTLLRTLTAASRPLAGTVAVDGHDLHSLTALQRSRLIGLVATEGIHAGALTVAELVALGRQPHTGFLGRLSDDDRQIVAEAIENVGIAHKAQSYVAQLSDGERQKAMIARALAQSTPLIVLDEPTAFLDVASRIETMRLLSDLAHQHDKAILLSTHDISQAVQLSDDIWLITDEREVVTGPAAEIAQPETMNRIFAGDGITFNASMKDFQITSRP